MRQLEHLEREKRSLLTSSSFNICSSGGGAGAGASAGVVAAGAGGGATTAGALEGPSVPGNFAGTLVPGLGGSEGCSGDPAAA